jgi:pimeloyl-ACP methyl ester carboxylesterase
VILIHGAVRNAADYFAVGMAAASMQQYFLDAHVAVFAPHFLEPQDGPVQLSSGAQALRWNGTDPNGVWRYGAKSLPPSNISSYSAVDAFAEALADRSRFPSLRQITVAGHSSGGQFVQRWALTSSSHVWEIESPKLRAVVANPSSFCYLDQRRFVNGNLVVPPSKDCSDYNKWEWGLEEGGEQCEYKDEALAASGGAMGLAKRYFSRDVVYLSGGSDICNVSKGWCHSHGLEMTCADMLQGPTRLARSENFFAFLKEYAGQRVHSRLVVPGVGHDHALIFESSQGQEALFVEAASDSMRAYV